MPIVVRVSGNAMEAVAIVSSHRDEALDAAVFDRALLDSGVTCGVDSTACASLIEALKTAVPETSVEGTVARGLLPVDGDDGRIELAVEYSRHETGSEDASGHVDYHDHGAYTPIAKGQLIATIVAPTAGRVGRNVLGQEIVARPGGKAHVTAGPGTTLAEGGAEVRATRDGDLRYENGRFEVLDLIQIRGDLAFETGNIDCEGSVRIEGDVRPGFHVRARGDVFVGGVVESGEVASSGKVTIRLGAVRGSRIRASEIAVGYVNGSYLESDGDIHILKEAVSSTVVAGGSISIPAPGRALGGSLHAWGDIEVGSAGSATGAATLLLAAGVDPLERAEASRLAAAVASSRHVQSQIGRVRDLAGSAGAEELDRLLSRAESEGAAWGERLSEVADGARNLEGAIIRVRGALHAGVRIRIGSGELTIDADRRGGTFRHDSESGTVIGHFGSEAE